MLAEQIGDRGAEKTKFEFGFDLKFIKALFSSEKEINETNSTKITDIENYLASHDMLGLHSENKPWIKGILDSIHYDLEGNANLFICNEVENVSIALIGSKKNIVGESSSTSAGLGYWSDSLNGELIKIYNQVEKDPDKKMQTENMRNMDRLPFVISCLQDDRIEPRKIEFVAKKICQLSENGKMYILATPLYIAIV